MKSEIIKFEEQKLYLVTKEYRLAEQHILELKLSIQLYQTFIYLMQ